MLAYWDSQYQKILLKILDGVFADNAVNDDGILFMTFLQMGQLPDETNKISAEAIPDAASSFWEMQRISFGAATAMHSVGPYCIAEARTYRLYPDHEANVGWGTYLDKSVIVDDGSQLRMGPLAGPWGAMRVH